MGQKVFTPQIIDDNEYALFAVELSRCCQCKALMVRDNKTTRNSNPFPRSIWDDYHSQAKRAGLRISSEVTINDEPICGDCKKNGAVTFTCYICRKEMPTNFIQLSIGYLPADYLCKACYESVSAREWEETVDKLEENHKYDYD